ncbi:prolyl oligopeptidase family serine peptidase [Luteococcus sp. Sow4_B9]|uniref:prolyl oligopeptidase family serine peptidase n=1 Tax=Luteococcus sp. Sow4_B9 TaxID=3438792 RepID=UPI003F9E0E88
MPNSAPATARDDVVEVLHGHQVADSHRWLEDVDSPRVQQWVKAQQAHTESVLGELPGREWFLEQMTRVIDRPTHSTPWHSHGLYLQSRREVGQRQHVLYAADSLEELLAGGRVLVDPNTWSDDGSSSLAFVDVSPDGHLVAIGRQDAGSDWTTITLVDAQGQPVDDDAVTAKFSRATWLPDSSGFVYNCYPDGGRADGTETRALPAAHLVLHRVGRPVLEDEEILDFEEDPQKLAWLQVSDDDQWLVLHVARGTERANQLWLLHLHQQDGLCAIGQRVEVFTGEDAAWEYLGTRDGEILLLTDDDAANSRIVALDEQDWSLREVVPEGASPIRSAVLTASGLLVETLEDASPVLRRHDLMGGDPIRVELNGGSVVALRGRSTSDEVFVGMSTITEPERSWRLDMGSGQVQEVAGPDDGWQPPAFRVERRRATSQDGTRVPYFLILPEPDQTPAGDPETNAPLSTILYGYGGFDTPVHADFRTIWPGWLAAGGAIAIANLRGGGEFGREWYDGGRRANKQNCFDDFIAVAEDLVEAGVTTPDRLAIHGKSNGGLLVGAAMTQRPELFAAALPHVGVLDCLRFHKFTVGAAWISDYGDPDDAEEFERILAWSPLHNVRDGERYPATLVFTSDHDDRVVPPHSYKFAAALQHAQAGEAPVLIRIEEATGHGLASKPPAVAAQESADLLAFAAHHTGLSVPGAADEVRVEP